MTTEGQCIGGHADGLPLDPPDDNEPDDWPDFIEIQDRRTGLKHKYWIRSFEPVIKDGKRIYYYDHESLLDDSD